jgi:hypothetical protein
MELNAAGIRCHVWARRELENYLLDVRTIARITGVPVVAVEGSLAEVGETFEAEVQEDGAGATGLGAPARIEVRQSAARP